MFDPKLPASWKPVPRTVVHPGGPWWPRWLARLSMGRWLPLLVLGYLIGQAYDGGYYRVCDYASTLGRYTMSVPAERSCPLTVEIES
jgi:hypothetical protein